MPWETETGVPTDEIRGWVASRLRAFRQGAGWSQTRLAEAMSRLGYSWAQVTVTDSERGRRGLAIDELLGLAALFGVPLAAFLLPESEEEADVLLELGISAGSLIELVLGHGGALGTGGAGWEAAREVVGAWSIEEGDVPATDLHDRVSGREEEL